MVCRLDYRRGSDTFRSLCYHQYLMAVSLAPSSVSTDKYQLISLPQHQQRLKKKQPCMPKVPPIQQRLIYRTYAEIRPSPLNPPVYRKSPKHPNKIAYVVVPQIFAIVSPIHYIPTAPGKRISAQAFACSGIYIYISPIANTFSAKSPR